MGIPIDWLLEGEPWIAYRARVDLLGQRENDPQVIEVRQAMLTNPAIRALLSGLAEWPGEVISSHKNAGLLLHKLVFAAEVGLTAADPEIAFVITGILEHQSSQGPFQVLMNIPVHFGGSGKDEWTWALCDAPLVVYALGRFGLAQDPRVSGAVAHLVQLARDNGWPCAADPKLGVFRGPGRKDDPCPYANLVMLQAVSQFAEWRGSSAFRAGAETLLSLWEQSTSRHPYLFHMGNDFRKLKAPLVWYDLLHVLDVLSRFEWLRHDSRLLEMASMLRSKADSQGRFTPESIWTAWKDWEFGQKQRPSRWLTLLAWRALIRLGLG